MKTFYFLCFSIFILLFSQNLKSQDTTHIQGFLQYVMQPLDKNQIGNGFLEEYGLPAISMATYNGTLSANNRMELNSWRLLYFQLFTGWCKPTANPMTPISTINNVIKTNTAPNLPTAIPLLIGEYNTVKSNAFSSNLLSYNASQRKVYDVPGRSQSPYESKRLFAAVPVNQYSREGSESFIYRSNMVWGNTNLTVTQLQINFDNGDGMQTLTANTPININYTDTGAYVWTIKATLSDNSIVQCYSDYFVMSVPIGMARFEPFNVTTPSWGNIAPVAGVHSGATVNIIYSSKQPTVPVSLRKPLIVVENMDAFNIAPSLQNLPYTINDFLRAIDRPLFDGGAYDFNNQLDDIAGYDLVFIDFTNGTDGIVRNAAVVQKVIEEVNNAKQFDNRSGQREQNVVLGIGTGGLHARYALANMTKNFISTPTETRLLITHDAPHRGSNIALGLQHLSRMLGNFSYFGTTSADIFPEYAETVALLNEPINVETLLYRATSDVANSPNTFMNTTYRTMVDFTPGTQPYRFVPTSLGNECANPLFSAGRDFMNFGMGIATGVKTKLAVFGISILTVPLIDLKYDCAVFARTIPEPSIANRKVAELTTIFKFILFGTIVVAKPGYDESAEAPTSYFAVDGVPGSFNTILDFNELRNYADGIGNLYFEYNQFLFEISYKKIVGLKFYAFVKGYAYNTGSFTTQYTALPVGSALDVDPFNSNTFTEKYVNGANPNYPSKGNTFIAQESNMGQLLFNNASMRFTARNARFLFNEMEGLANYENCSNECSNPYLISGNNIICTNGSFSIPGLPTGASIAWTVSPENIADLSCTNCLTPTLTKVNNGKVMLTAIVTNACFLQGFQVQSEITIGTPSPYIGGTFNDGGSGGNQPLENTYNEVYNTTVYVSLAGLPQYTWDGFYTNGNVSWYHPTPLNLGLVINFYPPPIFYGDYIGFDIHSTNICGTASEPLFFYYAGPSIYYRIAPNPVQSTFTITQLEQKKLSPLIPKKKEVSRDLIKIQIIDKMGKQVLEQSFSNYTKSATINVSALKADIYTVRVFTKDHEEQHKIVVQH